MNEETRGRILEFVRPLAAGLDGVTNFGDIARAVAAAEKLAADSAGLDRDLLFLLAVFSGQEKWVARMGHGSRTRILLESLGIGRGTISTLLRGLARLTKAPETPEERIVHDAVLLDAMGAYGIARLLAEAYRERLDILEMAVAIEEAASRPLHTEAGRFLAEPRRRAMLAFAARLREEHAEFGGLS